MIPDVSFWGDLDDVPTFELAALHLHLMAILDPGWWGIQRHIFLRAAGVSTK